MILPLYSNMLFIKPNKSLLVALLTFVSADLWALTPNESVDDICAIDVPASISFCSLQASKHDKRRWFEYSLENGPHEMSRRPYLGCSGSLFETCINLRQWHSKNISVFLDRSSFDAEKPPELKSLNLIGLFRDDLGAGSNFRKGCRQLRIEEFEYVDGIRVFKWGTFELSDDGEFRIVPDRITTHNSPRIRRAVDQCVSGDGNANVILDSNTGLAVVTPELDAIYALNRSSGVIEKWADAQLGLDNGFWRTIFPKAHTAMRDLMSFEPPNQSPVLSGILSNDKSQLIVELYCGNICHLYLIRSCEPTSENCYLTKGGNYVYRAINRPRRVLGRDKYQYQ